MRVTACLLSIASVATAYTATHENILDQVGQLGGGGGPTSNYNPCPGKEGDTCDDPSANVMFGTCLKAPLASIAAGSDPLFCAPAHQANNAGPNTGGGPPPCLQGCTHLMTNGPPSCKEITTILGNECSATCSNLDKSMALSKATDQPCSFGSISPKIMPSPRPGHSGSGGPPPFPCLKTCDLHNRPTCDAAKNMCSSCAASCTDQEKDSFLYSAGGPTCNFGGPMPSPGPHHNHGSNHNPCPGKEGDSCDDPSANVVFGTCKKAPPASVAQGMDPLWCDPGNTTPGGTGGGPPPCLSGCTHLFSPGPPSCKEITTVLTNSCSSACTAPIKQQVVKMATDQPCAPP